MNKIFFTSGLGNQLFQLAFGLYLKKHFDKETHFSYLCNYKGQLNLWDIFDIKFLFKDIHFSRPNYSTFLQSQKYIFLRALIKFGINRYFNVYTDKNISNFEKIFHGFKIFPNNSFLGYWQDIKFIEPITSEIKNLLVFNEHLDKAIYKKFYNRHNNLVAIHIRGGDYLKKKNKKLFRHIDNDYYLKSIKNLEKKISNPFYVIFSDDYNYAINFSFLKNINYEFIHSINHSRDNDFQYMSLCDHFILPNSTFSWWAAFISNNEKKNIYLPNNWFMKIPYNNFNLKNFSNVSSF